MKFQLNTQKSSFCTIGSYPFSFGNPEFDVDLDSLSEETQKQLLYNVKRGVLVAEDLKALFEKFAGKEEDQKENYVLAERVPIRAEEVQESIEDVIDKNTSALKSVLQGTIASIKREATNMRVGNLRKLLELEREGKNRITLCSFLEERLGEHQRQVEDAKGTGDMDPLDRVRVDSLSTQLSDVVVSEEQEVLVPQEVLNRLATGE